MNRAKQGVFPPQFFDKKEPQRLPTVTDLLSQSWHIFLQKKGIFIKILLLPVGLFFLFNILLAYLEIIAVNNQLTSSAGALWLIFLVIFSIAIIIISTMSNIALVLAVADTKNTLRLGELYGNAWPKTLSMLWIGFLVGIVILVGIIFFIVPGILFFLWYGFASYVFVLEGIKGSGALKKSKKYVQGRTFQIAGRVFGYLLVLLAIYFVSDFLAGLLSGGIDSFYSGNVNTEVAAKALLGGLIFFIVAPLSTSYWYFLYRSLQKREIKR